MKKSTYYHIILDQSGSMQDCLQPTISGFNEQLQVIRSLQRRFPDQEVRVGLTCFNDEVQPLSFGQTVDAMPNLNPERYQPNGSTALYDAIGSTILKIKDGFRDQLASGDLSVIVVILTDGYENASRMFPVSSIRQMIREQEATNQWTFTYLGATLDAREVAESLNIRRENSMAFDKLNFKKSYNTLNHSLETYFESRAAGVPQKSFLRDEEG